MVMPTTGFPSRSVFLRGFSHDAGVEGAVTEETEAGVV
jgi:hypothetical protein